MIINQMYFLQIEETTETVRGELFPVQAIRKGYETCAQIRRLTSCRSPRDVKGGEGSWFHFYKDQNFLCPLEALINFLDPEPWLRGAQRADQTSNAGPAEQRW